MRYVGVSAGAILAGPTCDTAYWKGWDDPLVVPQEAREASLVSWIYIKPVESNTHITAFVGSFLHFLQFLCFYAKPAGYPTR